MLRVAVFVAAATALLSSGCSAHHEAVTKTIEISLDEVLGNRTMSRDISLSVGDTLQLSLGANNSTPYRWTDPLIGEPMLVRETQHDYTHIGNMPGAPGVEVWWFKALKAGTTTILTVYAENWAGNTKPACTFTANVTVH